MPLSFEDYQTLYKSNPDAFIEGARAFCKYAASEGYPRLPLYDPDYLRYQLLLQRQRQLKDENEEDEEDERSLWQRIKPWVLALGGGALAMHMGSAWGRHAERRKIPFGPIKGPIMEFVASLLPRGTTVVWPNGGRTEGRSDTDTGSASQSSSGAPSASAGSDNGGGNVP